MQTATLFPEPASASAQVLARIITAQSEMTAAMPDTDAVMRLVTRYAMELSGATGASISVRDGDEVYLPVNVGFTGRWEGTRYPIDSIPSGQCLLTGEQIYVPDMDFVSPEASEIARLAHVRTFLAVPLRHQERVVAALSVAAPQPHAFGEDAILIVQLLARLAGSKLAHAQAFHDLTRALEDARQARAEAADFAGMIAHELGSPIAAIQNAADVLELGTLSPHQARARELIALEARALRMLVGDLRAAAALEREAFDLQRRVVAVDSVLGEAGDFAQSVAGAHPVHVQAGSGLRIDVDPGRIAQVLRNLITNAAKYTPPGTPIELRAWRDPAGEAGREAAGEAGKVWLAVVDAGPGIAPQDREVIFAKFGRARQPGAQAIPGLGLGLYLSQRIVDAHGGELVVTAPPGGGACFAFSVPLAP